MPQYSGVWSLQQQMQALTSGRWATDPLFDYTTLLLQGDAGANGAQNNVFYDTSPNQFAITRNGNTTQGTFSPFSLQPGAWSNFFNGSNAYLSIGSNAVLAPGTGNFWVECWINLSNLPSSGTTYAVLQNDALGVSTNDKFWFGVTNNAGTYRLQVGRHGTSDASYVNWTPSIGVWYHIAYGRSSGTSYLFIDGVSQTVTGSLSGISFGQNGVVIGAVSTPYYFPGYISNLRYIVGAVLYTSTFTPSTTPLTTTSQGASSSQVEILTCQDNRFVDNSTNAFTITANGTPSVQAFSPFAPQFQYTATGTGGSGYFDGTGDFLNTPTSANLAMGSGDFTIECWVYVPVTGFRYIFDIRPSASQALGAYVTSSSLYVNSGSTLDILASSAFVLNAWNHFAYVRSGSGSNNISIYLNGSRVYQRTDTTNYSTSPIVYIGADNTGSYSNGGYISGFRILKGTAQYSGATITLPTAPPTAITNTQLLLNFTNAGILDGTMKNNLETVADAKVSTSVVKYGSGSMYFDGTGDRLVAPASQNTAFRTGDFTIEFWAYPTSSSVTYRSFIDTRSGSVSTGISIWQYGLALEIFGSAQQFTAASALTINTWQHVAVVRLGTTVRVFVNGTQIGSSYTNSSDMTDTRLVIADDNTSTYPYIGYLDDFRITKGIARYTQNFIPPSVALPRQ